jgi:hypothetical protein
MTSEQLTPPMPAGPRGRARHRERIGLHRILKVLVGNVETGKGNLEASAR